MTKSFIKTRTRFRKLFAARRLETGFSMLEAVVVVGVLLALAVGGFLAYGPITENAKKAAVKSAASTIHTAVLVASIDGDPLTTSEQVIEDWNASNSKIRAEILEPVVEIAAMSTAVTPSDNGDICVQTTDLQSPNITAQEGFCEATASAPIPDTAPPAAPIVVTAGDAISWGQNNQGQLGTGDNSDSSIPRDVFTSGDLAGKKLSTVSSGGTHTCVLSEGVPYCWGQNIDGQLGSGPRSNSAVPLAVTTSGVLSGKVVTTLAAGGNHTCALAAGVPYCWGDNAWGQLGNNSTVDSAVPVAVNISGVLAGKTVTAISSGYNATCAVADGAAYCWGRNSGGQLGNNSNVNSSVPVAVNTSGVLSGKTITAISAGGGFACVLADGLTYCWGNNTYGQLGNNSTALSSIPVAVNTSGVLSGKTVTSLSVGDNHVCAVATSSVYCWGVGGSGNLGNSGNANSSVPVAVTSSGSLSGKTVTTVSSGGSHTCVIASATAYCWGYNYYGTLGNSTTTGTNAPVEVIVPPAHSAKTLLTIDAGNQHTVAIYG